MGLRLVKHLSTGLPYPSRGRSPSILVTGGAGFIGHHLIQSLLRDTDWRIVSLDRLDTSGNLNRLAEVMDDSGRLEIVFHDLKAPINAQVASRIGDVDYIVHMAAGSHVDRSIEYPAEFVMDNVLGTCHLLDFARDHCREKMIYFSTDEVFGPAGEGIAFKEWDRYRSGNPYSASKAGGEELCLAYNNTYGVPVLITHTMNVIGKRQHPEKYVPTVIRKVKGDDLVTVHSNALRSKAGSRHYIDARDVADAVMFLIERGDPGDKYNIVGEREMDNLELAEHIAKIMDRDLKYELVDFHSSRPGHDLRYALDGTKMREMGWEPRQPILERLEDIVYWTLENNRWLML